MSLTVGAGERVALIGPNGAGKTSLLSAVAGVVAPAGGHVRIDGRDMTHARSGAIVRSGVSLLPEGRQVFPSLTAEANLLLGAYGRVFRREIVSGTLAYLARRGEIRERLERIYDLMPKLAALRARPAGHTSGGEQQMIAIGRALMAEPRLLLVDELSLGLAPVIVQSLSAFLRTLNEDEGVAILLVEQNARLAFDLCPRAYVLEAGHCHLSGSSAELRDDPRVRGAYLGGMEAARG
ncbi:MAG TPA: ABC transporter ATP-binding protein [Gaiellaceae bacterium]|nr:ABC transporter ATP-binding protein [Gaiellaceae bacterium]